MRATWIRAALVSFASAAIVSNAAAQPSPGIPLSENFDSVTPPALPYGWMATSPAGAEMWVTDASNPDTPPNEAYLHSVSIQADERLDSPPVPILTAGAQLTFRHRYSFANGPCGGFPEKNPGPGSIPQGCWLYPTYGSLLISVGGGDFQDILAAGGSFVAGGYNLGNVWAGGTSAYGSVVVNLPASAAGTNVLLRWRLFTELNLILYGFGDWWVDSVQICDGFACDAVPQPKRMDVDTAGNGVWEAGETVDVGPYYYNNGDSTLGLTAGVGDVAGPPGSTFGIPDGAADYGDIPPGALGGCVFTGNCFQLRVDDGGTRPAQHWDEQLWEDLSTGGTVVWAMHVGGSFPDAPASNPFYYYIETAFHRGITGGCGGTNYCPDNPALRKQMAVFLLKSKYGAAYVPPPAAGIFADVPASDPFAPWIENLYNLGVTGGCSASPLSYCPNQTVLRKQMAAFLLKTLNGSGYTPPACQGLFPDVACPSPFADWIEALYTLQIAAGCGNGNFCPDSPNTRGQMAVFLAKTFGLTLYGP